MGWRKVHLDGEAWEWQIGKGVATHGSYIVIRSPLKIVTSVPYSEFGFERIRCPTCHQLSDDRAVTPGKVKEYIERNRKRLSVKPGKGK